MKDEFDRWARFFSGNSSEKEREELQHWIDSSTHNQEYASEMRELWQRLDARRPTTQNLSVNESWNAVVQRARVERRRTRDVKERPPVRKTRGHSVFRTGIILSAIFIPVLLYFLMQAVGEDTQPLITYASERGERLGVRLNDGSMVYLSVDSKLSVPEKFAAKTREVELEGEAYFEVKTDEQRPFLIHSRATTVQVLGTEFNLRAYEGEEQVTLLVTEGRVSFNEQGKDSRDASLVIAGQRGRYAKGKPILVENYEDMNTELGWRDGKLMFIDKTLGEITRELERWYATTFSFQEEQLTQIKITASFDLQGNEPLGHVLDIIANTANVEYIRGEDTVEITR